MWQTLRKEEVIRNLQTSINSGLTEDEVKRRQLKYGKNKLKDKPKESVIIKFLKQFQDFMIIILIIASSSTALL